MVLLKSFGYVYDFRYLEPTILAISVVPDQPNMVTLVYFVARAKVVGSSEQHPLGEFLYLVLSKLWPPSIDHFDFNGTL